MTDSPQPDRETAMHEIAEKLIALLDEAARRGVFIDKDGVTGCVEAPIGGEWVRMDLHQGYGVCYPQEMPAGWHVKKTTRWQHIGTAANLRIQP